MKMFLFTRKILTAAVCLLLAAGMFYVCLLYTSIIGEFYHHPGDFFHHLLLPLFPVHPVQI